MTKKLLILGAGPTGLGAAYRLLQNEYNNWSISERNSYVGGLSASFRDKAGFTWDVGGHIVFSHYDAFDRFFNEMTEGQVIAHERRSFIRIAGCNVPYPFQNNIRHLPPALLEECLAGLEAAQKSNQEDTSNFLQWNLSRLGAGIVRLFIEPDNRKRWACPLDIMSADWVAERVSPVDLERIRENIRAGRDDISWGPNNLFQFPKHGGTGSIFEAMRPRLGEHLTLNREAVGIDPEARIVRFDDGSHESYDRLLSTLPINQLVAMIDTAPGHLIDQTARLRHADSLIVGIGLRGQSDPEKCWLYAPEEAAPFYRVTYFANYSHHNAPNRDHYSLMCDISYSDILPRDSNTIIEETIQGLIATDFIAESDRDKIVSTHLIEAPYSYPVPTLDRDVILADAHAWLEPLDIHSRGRFGSWLYEAGNMDHCTMQGMQWADAMLSGKRESVFLDRK